MPMPPPARKLRKREIVFAVGIGAIAAAGAGALLSSDGDYSGPPPQAEVTGEKTYEVGEFERIATTGPQDIEIEFGETHSVRAEGAVGRLEVVVENGELIIRPQGGMGWDWPGFASTTVHVTVPRLTRVWLNGSGEISIDRVVSDRFAAAIEGFGGDMTIDGLEVEEAEFTINGGPGGEIVAAGTARATRVTINGPGEFQGGDLKSQTAAITVRGPGDVELAVQQNAEVSVQGPGEVDIEGPARCTVSASGMGSVSCGGLETD